MDINQILLKYWGYNSFRPLQEDIIQATLDGKDTLALLPTGGGKSICFQVPAMSKDGICIVISPLIALMKDQVENLQKRGIPAIAIYSGMTKREIDIALDNCVYGKVKFLYLSPERVNTELFKARYEKMNVNLIAVDESHCISQWGFDFRPSYRNIQVLREFKPDIPILALTATATADVVEDIQEQLGFKEKHVLQKSFERKNLAYSVYQEENKDQRILQLLNEVQGSGIIYARTRKRTKEIAAFLMRNGVSVDFYHAGLSNEERSSKQVNWINDGTRIMVATNAFGMGIDKSNVRLVIHADLPDSLEAYFQEAGRAGRDEQSAQAIMLVGPSDRTDLEQRIISSFPDITTIKQVYQSLANYYQIPIGSAYNESYDFSIIEFSNQYNLSVYEVYNCLKFLEKEGYIYLSESTFNPSRVKFEIQKDGLYEFQVKNPKFDPFVKLLLRSYSGLFENYVTISEAKLAGRLKTSQEKITQLLNYLNSIEVISYLPETNKPQLTYLTERLAIEDVRISKEHYHDRKEVAVQKMEGVVHFASEGHKCRSEILLAYFGEKDVYRCGVCDVCLERNKLNLSDVEFSTVSDQIKELLKEKPLPLTELVQHIESARDDKVIKVIQWLMDNEKLITNNDNLLEWRK